MAEATQWLWGLFCILMLGVFTLAAIAIVGYILFGIGAFLTAIIRDALRMRQAKRRRQ